MSPRRDVELALTASGRSASCALRLGDGRILADDGAPQRGADVALGVDAILRRGGVARSALAAIRTDVGPGSYTGLRVALTFVRFLSAFGSIPIRTVTSLELLALAARARGGASIERPLRPVLDARRGRFHTARIAAGETITTTEAPRAIPLDELVEALSPDDIVLADEQVAATLRAHCGARTEIATIVPFDASDLFDPRLQPQAVEATELEPLYLMGSYAEEA